jgi:DNA-binding response OmpR family regulator
MEFHDAKDCCNHLPAFSGKNKASVDVSVIGSDLNYKQVVKELLHDAGYSPRTHDVSPEALQSECANVVVVCFRAETDGPKPFIPAVCNGKRVVVFSNHTTEVSIVHCLENGAHHHIFADQSSTILQARLEAALRQHDNGFNRFLEVEPFRFDLERRNIYLDNKLVNLSPKEYEFAYYLFVNRHRVVVNAELMMSVWSLPANMDARRIDTAACRVRKKLQLTENSSGWCLRRIRRVGYELLCKAELDNSLTSPIHAFAEPHKAKEFGQIEHTSDLNPLITKYANA